MIFINSRREKANKDSALNKLKGTSSEPKKVVKPKPSAQQKANCSNKNRETEIDLMIRDRLAFIERVNTDGNLNDDRIDARNNLKSYCYNLVESIEDSDCPKEDKKALML